MAVGDILNQNSNSLVVLTTEGWCYIYNNTTKKDSNEEETVEEIQEGVEQVFFFRFFLSSHFYTVNFRQMDKFCLQKLQIVQIAIQR